jgi:hypothetical protein
MRSPPLGCAAIGLDHPMRHGKDVMVDKPGVIYLRASI